MADSSSQVEILPPIPADLPFLQAIYSEAVLNGTASFELEPPDLAEITRRYHALVDQNFPYFVAKNAVGKLLGYAYAGPYRPRMAYRFTVEDSIYIAPEAQGLGVGRALLAKLVDDATEKGFRQMIAVIGDSQHTASIALHERLGFAHIGVFRDIGWKQNRWLDSVLMQKSLGSGAHMPAEL
ncbi:MAG: N-acetyltransferase family protein [Hyphomicrobiales bacterium]